MERLRLLPCVASVCALAALALPICAQDSSSAATTGGSSTAATTSAAPAASTPAPAKVWTNEDVPALREGSTISTVGTSNGRRSPSTAARPTAAGRRDAKWYADQITKLQDQLPVMDARIAELQAGIDGKFTGDGQTSTRPRYAHAGDWPTELAQLKQKRADIETRISALRDQARHAGIPPNALP